MIHIAKGCYERNPAWVEFPHTLALALMGRTKAEQDAKRKAYAELAKKLDQPKGNAP
jgi:hypothetical protein